MEIKKISGKFLNTKKQVNIDINNFITRNEEIDATDLDGEVVMMNLEKGQYFMMNKVGSRIWEIIHEPVKVTSIISILLGEYDVEEMECQCTVIQFLNNLKNAELINVD